MSERDFQRSKQVYARLLKALGSPTAQLTQRRAIHVYNGATGRWQPSLLLGDTLDSGGRVRVLYLSPIPHGFGRRPQGSGTWVMFPLMSASSVDLADVRVAAQRPPELDLVLRRIDSYFTQEPRVEAAVAEAIWRMNFPDGHERVARKWGRQRIDPPRDSSVLRLPPARLRQRLRGDRVL